MIAGIHIYWRGKSTWGYARSFDITFDDTFGDYS